MAHNPPVFAWLTPRPGYPDEQWLMVDHRLSGSVMRRTRVEPSGPLPAGEEIRVGGTYYAGVVRQQTIPGQFATIQEAKEAVEEEYRNQRWPAR